MDCASCHKSFTTKQSLQYHISHNVCKKSGKKCPKCGYNFANKSALLYHVNNDVCGSSKVKTKIILKKKCDEMSKEELYEENLRLRGENQALKEHPQTVNNNQQINIIVPPAFLEIDNYQQLAQQLPNLLHNALSKHPANFISYLIKETNCNPNRPLYNSVKISNKKDPFAKISDGEKYVYASKKNIIEQLIENKRHILQEYVDNHGDKYGEKILRRYQNYVDFLDDDKEAQKDLEIDIICMLLNVSDVIGSDEWSKKLLEELKIWEHHKCLNTY